MRTRKVINKPTPVKVCSVKLNAFVNTYGHLKPLLIVHEKPTYHAGNRL